MKLLYTSDDFPMYLFGLLVAIAISIGLFFLLRSLFLWYWKINKIVSNQEKTNWLLAKMYERDGGLLTPDQKKELGMSIEKPKEQESEKKGDLLSKLGKSTS